MCLELEDACHNQVFAMQQRNHFCSLSVETCTLKKTHSESYQIIICSDLVPLIANTGSNERLRLFAEVLCRCALKGSLNEGKANHGR